MSMRTSRSPGSRRWNWNGRIGDFGSNAAHPLDSMRGSLSRRSPEAAKTRRPETPPSVQGPLPCLRGGHGLRTWRSMGAHASADARAVLDAIRRIVRLLRPSDRAAEKKTGLSGAQLFVLQQLRAAGGELTPGELSQ